MVQSMLCNVSVYFINFLHFSRWTFKFVLGCDNTMLQKECGWLNAMSFYRLLWIAIIDHYCCVFFKHFNCAVFVWCLLHMISCYRWLTAKQVMCIYNKKPRTQTISEPKWTISILTHFKVVFNIYKPLMFEFCKLWQWWHLNRMLRQHHLISWASIYCLIHQKDNFAATTYQIPYSYMQQPLL